MLHAGTLSDTTELIAPCGMNCSVCSRYLTRKYDVKRKGVRMSYCVGCRPRDRKCALLKKRCDLLLNHRVRFLLWMWHFPVQELKANRRTSHSVEMKKEPSAFIDAKLMLALCTFHSVSVPHLRIPRAVLMLYMPICWWYFSYLSGCIVLVFLRSLFGSMANSCTPMTRTSTNGIWINNEAWSFRTILMPLHWQTWT